MRTALYPGSFDPVTYGHLDIIARAAPHFDRLVVAVFDRPNRRLRFDGAQRVALLREATSGLERVDVQPYHTLTVDYARAIGASVIIRGLRSPADLAAEQPIAQHNRVMAPDIETFFLIAAPHHAACSASIVREIAALGGDVTSLVPPHVAAALRNVGAEA
jgi:pantetheine-phosphate adenylyltransferase